MLWHIFGLSRTLGEDQPRSRADDDTSHAPDEIAVPVLAAEFAIRHNFKAHVVLHANDVADGRILDLTQCRSTDCSGFEFGTRLVNRRRPKETAHGVRAIMWPSVHAYSRDRYLI